MASDEAEGAEGVVIDTAVASGLIDRRDPGLGAAPAGPTTDARLRAASEVVAGVDRVDVDNDRAPVALVDGDGR